jgi:hypothetical protein
MRIFLSITAALIIQLEISHLNRLWLEVFLNQEREETAHKLIARLELKIGEQGLR